MIHILVAEDNWHTARLMKAILNAEGYQVHLAADGIEALEVLDNQHIDLILLDVMMPRMDGYEFTEQLRSVHINTPILMITAKHFPEERCKGFRVGTDDYMIKPVNEDEMLLRIKALLRRAKIAYEKKLKIGSVELDYNALSVTKNGETQTLPQKEFYLLYKLLSNPNRIYTRMQLMDEIWGADSETVDTTINVHVTRLRRRFEGWKEFEIVSIRGIGYKAVIYTHA